MAFPRISARVGNEVDLCVTFFRGGIPTDPYWIKKVEIYKTSVAPHNLVTTIPFVDVGDVDYPSPAVYATETVPAGSCGTEETIGARSPGGFCYPYLVPLDAVSPDVYFDVWYYHAANPCDSTELTSCDIDDYDAYLSKQCNKFWVYPDTWFVSDNLTNIRFGFEPLDQNFHVGDLRKLEVGLMPLPLYDFDYNLVMPMIPYCSATIKVETRHKELMVDNEPMTIGYRQGSFRTNPFTLQWDLDASRFLIGTYNYRITLTLPNGKRIVSKDFILTIS